jgi:hypothetical protein
MASCVGIWAQQKSIVDHVSSWAIKFPAVSVHLACDSHSAAFLYTLQLASCAIGHFKVLFLFSLGLVLLPITKLELEKVSIFLSKRALRISPNTCVIGQMTFFTLLFCKAG